MKRALIFNGLVVQVEPVGGDFPVAKPLYWTDAPDRAERGWVVEKDGAVNAPSKPPLLEAKKEAVARLVGSYQAEIAKYLTPGKDQIYARKREEAERWVRATSRALTDYPWALAETSAILGKAEGVLTEAEVQTTIDRWRAKIAYWSVKGIAIEKEYSRVSTRIAEASDHDTLEATILSLAWPVT